MNLYVPKGENSTFKVFLKEILLSGYDLLIQK